jgi:hypothetical protein
VGWLATMAPTFVAELVPGALDKLGDVALWTEDKELKGAPPGEAPEDAIVVPFALVEKLMRAHMMAFVSSYAYQLGREDAAKLRSEDEG